MNLFDRILQKTKDSFIGKITRWAAGRSEVSDDMLDELESILIGADIGVQSTVKIIEKIKQRVKKDKYLTTSEFTGILKSEIASLFVQEPLRNYSFDIPSGNTPYVIMVAGVNGVGKTTTIGKLAHLYKTAGKNVLIGAADTFRAAAIDQLKIWAHRAGVPVVAQQMGSDPGAVAFDAVSSAVARKADVVIIDTAGRLHSKMPLMNELSKVKKVINKVIPSAPHEVILVLDASTGQNAIEQAKQFTAAIKVNSIAVTKLDGTAKGGVIIGISDQFHIPVRYIGTGESIEDLNIFDPVSFVDSLFRK